MAQPQNHSRQQPESPTKNHKPGFFTRFATHTARLAGTSPVFALAVGIIIVWGMTGPLFQFSDTWQLVINTSTTIITFLMVFLIQNTQNRDSEALHLKIDELIRATRGANNRLIVLEDLDQKELDEFKKRFALLVEENDEPQDQPDGVGESMEEIAARDNRTDNSTHTAPRKKTGRKSAKG